MESKGVDEVRSCQYKLRNILRHKKESKNVTRKRGPKPKMKSPAYSKYRRNEANAKERERQGEINTWFEKLREKVPHPGPISGKCEKLRKIDILHVAINYIRALENILDRGDPGVNEFSNSLFSVVSEDKITKSSSSASQSDSQISEIMFNHSSEFRDCGHDLKDQILANNERKDQPVTLTERNLYNIGNTQKMNMETTPWHCKLKLKIKEQLPERNEKSNPSSFTYVSESAPSPSNSTSSNASSILSDSEDIFSDLNSNLELFHFNNWKDVSFLGGNEDFLVI